MSTTTVEQSKRLIELGLNPETADMIHPCLIARGEEVMYDDPVSRNSVLYAMHTSLEEKQKSILAWSSDRLLELIPKQISTNNGNYFLRMRIIDSKYSFYYDGLSSTHYLIADSIFEAIYNMTVWLLEHNYIKK